MISSYNLKAVIALSLLAALPLAAADGRIPIATAPYTISVPGHYYLTRDVAVPSGTAITISSNDVTLDLNGHTVANSTITVNNYAIATSAAYSGVRVTGGRVRGGYEGIRLYGASGGDYRVDRVFVDGTGNRGIHLGAAGAPGPRVVLEDSEVTATGGTSYGVLLYYVSAGRVSRLSTRGGNFGLSLWNASSVTIENSVFSAATSCLNIGSGTNRGVLVRGNTITNCTNYGIILTGHNMMVQGNLVQGSDCGLYAFSGDYHSITDNTLSMNTSYGLLLSGSTRNSVSRNTITNTTAGPGIQLMNSSSGNSLDWNVVSGNSGAGIFVSDAASNGNIYSYNRLNGNGAANDFGAGNISAGGNNAGGANF